MMMEGKKSNSKGNKTSSSTQNFFLSKLKRITNRPKLKIILSLIFIISITSTIVLTSILIGSDKNYTERDFTINNISMSRYDAAINYILGGHNSDGGFSPIPFRQSYQIFGATEMATDIFSTCYAVSSLILLNELSSLDVNLVIDYFDRYLNNSDYSEVDAREHGPRDLWVTYLVLRKLNATYILSIEDILTWTLDDFLPDGSFRPRGNVSASISSTKSAYLLLSEFESLDSINWTLSTQYILDQYLGNGYFQHPDVPGALNIISTLDAYSYLSYTNQLGLINISTFQGLETHLTDLYSMVYDEFNIYEGFSHRIGLIHDFIQFSWENNISFVDISPNFLELCTDIKKSQDKIYGGFPTFWDNYSTFAWIDDTAFVLETFYECDLLHLLNDNITVAQPPNSPYICKANSSYTLLSLTLTFILLVYLFKRKEKTSFHSSN